MHRKRVLYHKLWYVRRRNTARAGLLIRLAALIMAVFLLGSYINRAAFRAVSDISETRARELVAEAVNSTMQDYSRQGNGYSEFVSINKDSEGNTTAVNVNYAALNTLSQEMAESIGAKLEFLKEQEVKIPAGVLLGSKLFASVGPAFSARIIPVGSIETEFESRFLQAGINQTKHSITLKVKSVLWVMAFLAETRTEVVIDIPLTETIIVGNVPESYINGH